METASTPQIQPTWCEKKKKEMTELARSRTIDSPSDVTSTTSRTSVVDKLHISGFKAFSRYEKHDVGRHPDTRGKKSYRKVYRMGGLRGLCEDYVRSEYIYNCHVWVQSHSSHVWGCLAQSSTRASVKTLFFRRGSNYLEMLTQFSQNGNFVIFLREG